MDLLVFAPGVYEIHRRRVYFFGLGWWFLYKSGRYTPPLGKWPTLVVGPLARTAIMAPPFSLYFMLL